MVKSGKAIYSNKEKILLATSPRTFLYPVFCVHLDRACALLCDPNKVQRQ